MGLTTLVVALVPSASPAVAQSGDPSAGSPSGVIYEIPLDNARLDAAPRRRGGSDGGSGGGGSGGGGSGGGGSGGGGSGDSQGTAGAGQGGTVSPIRSENGFGSSSTVPGAAGIAAKKSSSGGDDGNGGASGTGGKGTGAQGSGGANGSANGASAESIRDAGSASITPSRSRAYVLLLLAVVLAAGLGIAGRYVARRR